MFLSFSNQFKCDNWHATAPVVASDSVGLAPFVQLQDGKLVYAGKQLVQEGVLLILQTELVLT